MLLAVMHVAPKAQHYSAVQLQALVTQFLWFCQDLPSLPEAGERSWSSLTLANDKEALGTASIAEPERTR